MKNALDIIINLPAITCVRVIRTDNKPNSYRVCAKFKDTGKIDLLSDLWPFCSIDILPDRSMTVEYPVKVGELEKFSEKVVASGLFCKGPGKGGSLIEYHFNGADDLVLVVNLNGISYESFKKIARDYNNGKDLVVLNGNKMEIHVDASGCSFGALIEEKLSVLKGAGLQFAVNL
jgi:hypothetical protein